MRNLLRRRFQLQLLFAMVAAVSVATLTVELMLNAVRHAETFVLSDAKRALTHATQELDREVTLRSRSDSTWAKLPPESQDLTLTAISQAVLSSYPGVEGGFFRNARFAGYSFPTHDGASSKIDVPAAEKQAIEEVIRQALKERRAELVLRGRRDLVVISALAVSDSDHSVCWVMKRLAGEAEQSQRTRSVLLVALVGTALVGAAGVLATGVGLTRGIAQITSGLSALHKEFAPSLPERNDELGAISSAINEMARTRRRLEAEIRREDRVRTTGHLVGRIAHEMRNPLNSMRLSLEVLSERLRQQRLRPEDFHTVIGEVDRMNRLLSDLLAFQQPRPPKLYTCAVGPVLEHCAETVRPQASKQAVNIVIKPDSVRCALVDEQYFQQIIVNLLLNAIDVSQTGGQIEIRSSAGDTHIVVEVADQGPGLSLEQKDHIFEPFYTTKAAGHGLGLAVSRELAHSMGGTLHWRSESSPGATFVLQLRRSNEVKRNHSDC